MSASCVPHFPARSIPTGERWQFPATLPPGSLAVFLVKLLQGPLGFSLAFCPAVVVFLVPQSQAQSCLVILNQEPFQPSFKFPAPSSVEDAGVWVGALAPTCEAWWVSWSSGTQFSSMFSIITMSHGVPVFRVMPTCVPWESSPSLSLKRSGEDG